MRISDWSSDVCSSDLLGFIDREPGDLFSNARLGDRPHHCGDQLVDLLLGVILDLRLRCARTCDERGDFLMRGGFFLVRKLAHLFSHVTSPSARPSDYLLRPMIACRKAADRLQIL